MWAKADSSRARSQAEGRRFLLLLLPPLRKVSMRPQGCVCTSKAQPTLPLPLSHSEPGLSARSRGAARLPQQVLSLPSPTTRLLHPQYCPDLALAHQDPTLGPAPAWSAVQSPRWLARLSNCSPNCISSFLLGLFHASFFLASHFSPSLSPLTISESCSSLLQEACPPPPPPPSAQEGFLLPSQP